MSRIIKKFDAFRSICEHCDGGTKVETITGIVACETCGTEDPDFVPFLVECDFLREANKSRNSAFGVTEGPMEHFVDAKPIKKDVQHQG